MKIEAKILDEDKPFYPKTFMVYHSILTLLLILSIFILDLLA